MPDMEIIPHPYEQRSYAELRSEFRAASLQRVRDSITGKHPVGWDMVGDPIYARDKYSAGEWSYLMDMRLREPVTQSFGLEDVPFPVSIRIEKQAQAAMQHEDVTWGDDVEGVVDHDAAPCKDVRLMTDEEICDYVEKSIKESELG